MVEQEVHLFLERVEAEEEQELVVQLELEELVEVSELVVLKLQKNANITLVPKHQSLRGLTP